MGFKRFLAAFGVGGPSIDTVLASPYTYPGSVVEGHVELAGGEVESAIDEIALTLSAHVEVERNDGEAVVRREFARVPVCGAVRLAPGERRSIPFRYPVPWQAPLTAGGRGPLPGRGLGLRTDVVIAGALDQGDLDPVHVHPLPVQDRILEAFLQLGFTLKNTDIEAGRLAGIRQEFPIYQELEFHPAPRYAGEVREAEVSLVADPHGVDVVIEFDRRGGLFTEGRDVYGRFRAEHAEADRADWPARVDGWVNEALSQHRGLFGGLFT